MGFRGFRTQEFQRLDFRSPFLHNIGKIHQGPSNPHLPAHCAHHLLLNCQPNENIAIKAFANVTYFIYRCFSFIGFQLLLYAICLRLYKNKLLQIGNIIRSVWQT